MKANLGYEDGVLTRFHWDEENGAYISRHQDVGPILDINHAFRVDGQRDDPVLGRRVASIPATVYEEWCRLEGVPMAQFMRWPRAQKVALLKKYLNDRDWYRVKSVEGRV